MSDEPLMDPAIMPSMPKDLKRIADLERKVEALKQERNAAVARCAAACNQINEELADHILKFVDLNTNRDAYGATERIGRIVLSITRDNPGQPLLDELATLRTKMSEVIIGEGDPGPQGMTEQLPDVTLIPILRGSPVLREVVLCILRDWEQTGLNEMALRKQLEAEDHYIKDLEYHLTYEPEHPVLSERACLIKSKSAYEAAGGGK